MVNRKAILVLSFGTTDEEAKEKTIGCMLKKLSNDYPDYIIDLAFTSQMIIERLKLRQIKVKNISEVIKDLIIQGVQELYILPTHFIEGIEYNKMLDECMTHSLFFKTLKVAEPLLYQKQDLNNVIQSILNGYDIEKHTAILLMGHGSKHDNHKVYLQVQSLLTDLNTKNVFLATLEGSPSIYEVITQIKEESYKQCLLLPFMFLAGKHAKKDMIGDSSLSWKALLEKQNIEVFYQITGLAELESIQHLYMNKLQAIIKD